MDPEDMPTVLHVKDCRCAKSEDGFREKLTEELSDHQHRLPLDRFCTNGGAGGDVEIGEVDVTEFSKTRVAGTLHFSFTESYHSGCRDISWTERHNAVLEFSLNRKTGELELSGGFRKRGYEKDEF